MYPFEFGSPVPSSATKAMLPPLLAAGLAHCDRKSLLAGSDLLAGTRTERAPLIFPHNLSDFLLPLCLLGHQTVRASSTWTVASAEEAIMDRMSPSTGI